MIDLGVLHIQTVNRSATCWKLYRKSAYLRLLVLDKLVIKVGKNLLKKVFTVLLLLAKIGEVIRASISKNRG